MAGFNWNQFYTLFKAKMGDSCTVGRYTIPKLPTYPYCDIALLDNSGGNYDLQGHESSLTPLITITVYDNNYGDARCYEVSMKAKELMLSYGFQCRTGPVKIDNTDPAVARWVARYQRIFGSGDELRKLR
ncbi:MAG TPA: hypothetical protein H9742_14160 [Candidatus Acetatifactor stercoripullorum]|uniref:Uncharacterized protein n=1 Tax=Candidatus Acetatifactor stercoripullorum TaxID=2838414 RepID=A0A9D1R881_9FIRM|nr:hypothetical protein [Candidatus Acetatifactor stercoripullorum]